MNDQALNDTSATDGHTDLKRSERERTEALELSLAELREKTEAPELILATVAFNLHKPLTIIRISVERLRQELEGS
jgi:hypothetical protein